MDNEVGGEEMGEGGRGVSVGDRLFSVRPNIATAFTARSSRDKRG